MSVFYVLARLFLFSLHILVRFAAWKAEGRFQHEGNAVVAAEAAWKAANATASSGSGQETASASMLWALSERERQQAESRWLTWQGRSERLASARMGLARWAGASLLYLVSEVGGLTALNWDLVREVVDQVRYYHGG